MTSLAIERYAAGDSVVHRLDARAKIVGMLALLLATVTTPPQAFGAFAGFAGLLIIVAFGARLPLVLFLRRLLLLLPVVMVVGAFVPFIDRTAASGGYSLGLGDVPIAPTATLVFWNILIKAALGLFCITTLTSTTPMDDLLAGLERLRVPRVVVTLTGFVYRYLFVIVGEAQRMKRARDARCYHGRWLWHAKVIGQMVGVLFLRSYARAERVHLAMMARGFDGHFPARARRPLATSDYAFVCTFAGMAILLRVVLT